MTEKRMPVAERQQETIAVDQPSSLIAVDNWPLCQRLGLRAGDVRPGR
jgi:hypothetical protein